MSEINKIRNLSKDELSTLIKTCTSKQDVLRKLDIDIRNGQAKKFLIKFIDDNNIDVTHHRMGVPYSARYTKEDVLPLVESSLSWSDLMRKLDVKFIGNNITTVRKMVKEFDIPTDHFDYVESSRLRRQENGSLNTRLYEDIFCENSNAYRSTVKSRIIKDNLIPYECDNCKLSDNWCGNPLVLQLEHKNGINDDNRLDNLCFLCPNCHSQTASYAGRNVSGKKRAKDGSYFIVDNDVN